MKKYIQKLKEKAKPSFLILLVIVVWYCVWKILDKVLCEGATLGNVIILSLGLIVAWGFIVFILTILPSEFGEKLSKSIIGSEKETTRIL